MGRVYEALKVAEEEYQATLIESFPLRRKGKVVNSPWRESNKKSLEHYEQLKTNLFSSSPDHAVKTILFTSTAHGDGCSTTAINFVNTLTGDPPPKVLLLDANLRSPSLHEIFKSDHTPGLSEFLQNGVKLSNAIKRVGGSNLYFLPCGARHSRKVALFQAKRFTKFMNAMCDRFDYVVLDGPPAVSFPESLIMASKVDAVVLVFEAGKTRRQAVIRTKEEVEKAGCNILGMVMNRRKYYIPEWVYKRL